MKYLFPGNISNKKQFSYIKCAPGYYSNISAAIECIKSKNGTYSNITGTTSCNIQKELLQTIYKHPAQNVRQVPNGNYSNISGANSCNTCPDRSITNYFQTSCIQCSSWLLLKYNKMNNMY